MIYIGKLYILPEKNVILFLFEALSCFFKKHEIDRTCDLYDFYGNLA